MKMIDNKLESKETYKLWFKMNGTLKQGIE